MNGSTSHLDVQKRARAIGFGGIDTVAGWSIDGWHDRQTRVFSFFFHFVDTFDVYVCS